MIWFFSNRLLKNRRPFFNSDLVSCYLILMDLIPHSLIFSLINLIANVNLQNIDVKKAIFKIVILNCVKFFIQKKTHKKVIVCVVHSFCKADEISAMFRVESFHSQRSFFYVWAQSEVDAPHFSQLENWSAKKGRRVVDQIKSPSARQHTRFLRHLFRHSRVPTKM